MKNYLTQEKGVTLVELLATIILISIILLSFFTFFAQSAKHTQYNKGKLTAVDIAEEIIADIRDIENPAALEVMDFVEDPGTGEYINNSYENYEVRITISGDVVASVLQVARITVMPSGGSLGSSFTTEMYINTGGGNP